MLVGLIFVCGLAAGGIVQHLSETSRGTARDATRRGSADANKEHARATNPASTTSSVTTSGEGKTVGLLPADAPERFEKLEHALPGRVALAVLPIGGSTATTLGASDPVHGWSTTKIPVIAALMTASPQGLTSDEEADVRSAITESSNDAILALFHRLEALKGGLVSASEAVEQELRASGDTYTVVATAPPPPGAVTTFGQTEWSPEESVRFFARLDEGCLLLASETGHILNLMQQIEPSESWGLGSAGFSHVAFKGGWGPEGDAYLVRQSGIIDPGTPDATAVAIVAHPPPGPSSFEVGTEMLTRTATWLRENIHPSRHAADCGKPAGEPGA